MHMEHYIKRDSMNDLFSATALELFWTLYKAFKKDIIVLEGHYPSKRPSYDTASVF